MINRKKFVLLEGKILIKEALKVNCVRMERIFYCNKDFIFENNLTKNNEVVCHRISEDLMNLISNVKTNQGILGNQILITKIT